MNIVRCYRCMKQFDADIDDICPHCGYYQKEQENNPDLKKALEPGSILNGKYYIGCVLGVGGFAITYAAYNLANRSKVAIKEYFPAAWARRDYGDLTVDCGYGENAEQFKKGLEQFYKESHQLAMVGNHRGIVNVFEAFTENETAYIVMEFVDGVSLEELLRTDGPMQYTQLLQILLPICESLDSIHNFDKIIHRDIAPDNILLQPNGRAKLIDFGASIPVTQMNENIILKHGYAPIEQYDVDAYCDAATDVYAMSAVMYHMLTGKRPTKSTERNKAIQEGGNDPLPSPIEAGANIPQQLNDMLLWGLAVRPEDRPQSMREFADALQVFHTQATSIHTVIEDGEEKKPPIKLILGIVIPIVAIIAAVVVAVALRFSHVEEGSALQVAVPNVVDMAPDEAKKEIDGWITEEKDKGNTIEVVTEYKDTVKTSDKTLKGKIAEQSPAAGESVTVADEKIVLELAKYKYVAKKAHPDGESVEIPDLVGIEEAKAKKELNQKDLNYEVKSEYSNSFPEGTVISVSPTRKTTYGENKKNPIQIVVSKGAAPTTTAATTRQTTTRSSASSGARNNASTSTTRSVWTNAPTTTTTRPTQPPMTARPTTTTRPTQPPTSWTAAPVTGGGGNSWTSPNSGDGWN